MVLLHKLFQGGVVMPHPNLQKGVLIMVSENKEKLAFASTDHLLSLVENKKLSKDMFKRIDDISNNAKRKEELESVLKKR